MTAKRIAIIQSNYIPWKGYFNVIDLVDTFVILDDVQYTRRDWRNRNLIKSTSGLIWLTIPVESKGRYHHRIDQIRAADRSWNKRHWDTIYRCYRKAAHFSVYEEALEGLFLEEQPELLSSINLRFIKRICALLGINTPIVSASGFRKRSDKNLRLIDICHQLQGTTYYTGPSAKNYINEAMFRSQGIAVKYVRNDDFYEYKQLYPPFVHEVSIVDTLFNTGQNAGKYVVSPPRTKRGLAKDAMTT